MKTKYTQGSFITLIWTLEAKVKDVTTASGVPIHPRADMVAHLLLQPVVFRTMQRRLAEEARLCARVFRFSNSGDPVPVGLSGRPSKLFSR